MSRPKGTPKTGGRTAGTPNKLSLRLAEEAEKEVAAKRAAGTKIGKDMVEDFMNLFAGIAARYQPKPDPTDPTKILWPDQSEERFHKYGTLALKAAAELAQYQSPKLRAHQVIPPTPPSSGGARRREVKFSMFDRVIDVTPTKQKARG